VDFTRLIAEVPRSAQFIDEDFFIWGGSMYRDEAGACHLYYSRWPRSMGMNAWVTHSEVAHAVADAPTGPFRHVDVALPVRGAEHWDGLCTHNPTVRRFGDKLYLYYTGNTGDGQAIYDALNWTHRNNQRVGVAVAERPEGPWTRMDAPLIETSPEPDAPDHLCTNNPSVTEMHGGGYLIVYKAVASLNPLPFGGPVTHLAATAPSPTGPFTKNMEPVFTFPGHDFPAEDPYIWTGESGYFAIVKDFDGSFTKAGRSLALFTSTDGFDWKPAEHTLVATPEIRWKGGETQRLHRLERPQLWLEDGRPRVLYCAASPDRSESHSFNVHIPVGD
jgi:hypothetical protein